MTNNEIKVMPDREKVIKGLIWIKHDSRLRTFRANGDVYPDVISDALALLKAKQPRVMTLEEVKMLDSDYYYLESMRSPSKELREIVGAYGLTCVTWPGITWARQTMGDSGYGKTWRCWTQRPTEAQREAEPWAEPAVDVWGAIGEKPLFGHHSGKKSKTYWGCFMKTGGEG